MPAAFSTMMQVRNRLLRLFDAPRKYEGTAADLIPWGGFDRWEERIAVHLFCTAESMVRPGANEKKESRFELMILIDDADVV